ncbi:MAG: AMP phosphorylase [Nitrososphaeria archaeon]
MQLRPVIIDITSDTDFIILNEMDAKELDVRSGERAEIRTERTTYEAEVRTTGSLVGIGTVGLPRVLAKKLRINEKTGVEILKHRESLAPLYIREKLLGRRLTQEMIEAILDGISRNRISELDVLTLVMSSYYNGLDDDEIANITRSMVNYGNTLDFGGRVVDKHSVGGVPGNKVSLLIVPIISNTELLIPKTSSRAITSPSGTADTMSVLANVELEPDEIIRVVKKTHGCIVWNDSLGVAPADNLIIKVERPLRIDPEGLMIASILSKKLALGVKQMVLDIPFGRGTKVIDEKVGKELAERFERIGSLLNIQVVSALTYGSQPVGHAVGPALEAKEALEALITPSKAATSLINKSAALAGLLLESSGLVNKHAGYDAAMRYITNGKAYSKLREIIGEQGGNPNVRPDDLPIGGYTYDVTSNVDGYVTDVDNTLINQIAITLGAPYDKGAGLLLFKKENSKVRKGEKVMRLYAESENKLDDALRLLEKMSPINVSGMLLESFP